MIRRLAGLVLIFAGLWMGYAKAQGLFFYIARGASPAEAFALPQFFLPLTAAGLAILAGVLALMHRRGGAWLGWLAALVVGVIGAAIIAKGADISLWLQPLVIAAIYAAGSLVLSLRQRTA